MSKKGRIKLWTAVIFVFIIVTQGVMTFAESVQPDINARSCILMEASTGRVLYENNADEALPPASVTKIMTLLLIYESVDEGKLNWQDEVSVSEYAASMGGSQIFLEPNEVQSVEALTKSIAIASANDAAVAMAEKIGGSEEGFVSMMNEKAKKLGMKTANFKNACGLDTDGHLLSARDIALMSRELITKYPDVHKYTTTWQDSITHTTRRGTTEFGLTNTNKLLKQYSYATGLKTGSTSKALYCLSATAKKDNMELIAVIMAAPDPKVRFKEAAKLLDYGYANYEIKGCHREGEVCAKIRISKGKSDGMNLAIDTDVNALVKKGDKAEITERTEIPEVLQAPVKKGTKIGEIAFYIEDSEIGRASLVAAEDVQRANVADMLSYLIQNWI